MRRKYVFTNITVKSSRKKIINEKKKVLRTSRAVVIPMSQMAASTLPFSTAAKVANPNVKKKKKKQKRKNEKSKENQNFFEAIPAIPPNTTHSYCKLKFVAMSFHKLTLNPLRQKLGFLL
jgi:hypothetical protein